LPLAWLLNYGRVEELSGQQGYDTDADRCQMCGVTIVVVCSGSSIQLITNQKTEGRG